jgi:hypothetical protein
MGALKPKGLNSCYTMWNDAVYAILYEMMRFMLCYVKWCGLCYTMWNDAVYAILCEMMQFMLYYVKWCGLCYAMWNDAVYAILCEMMRFMLCYVKWCGLCYAMWNDAVYAILWAENKNCIENTRIKEKYISNTIWFSDVFVQCILCKTRLMRRYLFLKRWCY